MTVQIDIGFFANSFFQELGPMWFANYDLFCSHFRLMTHMTAAAVARFSKVRGLFFIGYLHNCSLSKRWRLLSHYWLNLSRFSRNIDHFLISEEWLFFFTVESWLSLAVSFQVWMCFLVSFTYLEASDFWTNEFCTNIIR